MIKLLLVDNLPFVLESIQDLVNDWDWAEVVDSATSGKEAMQKLHDAPPGTINMVLSDIKMARGGLEPDGLDYAKKIREEFPAIKVILLSAFLEGRFVQEAFNNGIHGFVSKAAPNVIKEIAFALKSVEQGDYYYRDDVWNALTHYMREQPPEPPTLTSRQKEVLLLIAHGLTAREIREWLSKKDMEISISAVNAMKEVLFRKFTVRNSVELVVKAFKMEVIFLDEVDFYG